MRHRAPQGIEPCGVASRSGGAGRPLRGGERVPGPHCGARPALSSGKALREGVVQPAGRPPPSRGRGGLSCCLSFFVSSRCRWRFGSMLAGDDAGDVTDDADVDSGDDSDGVRQAVSFGR